MGQREEDLRLNTSPNSRLYTLPISITSSFSYIQGILRHRSESKLSPHGNSDDYQMQQYWQRLVSLYWQVVQVKTLHWQPMWAVLL